MSFVIVVISRAVKIQPAPTGSIFFDCRINLRSEHLYKSKVSQYKVSGTTKSGNIFATAFKTIDRKDFVEPCGVDSYNSQKLSTQTEPVIFIFKLEIKVFEEGPLFRLKKYCATNANLELMDQYLNLLNDSTFSDFTFVVKEKAFKVHKNILASQSETMRAMFTTNFIEFVLGECIVDDIEPEIFQLMLHFMYAGKICANLDDVAMDLYRAAHYYRIVKLMEICKENIHFRLNASNAQEIYELSTLYDMEDVKLEAWNIVK